MDLAIITAEENKRDIRDGRLVVYLCGTP